MRKITALAALLLSACTGDLMMNEPGPDGAAADDPAAWDELDVERAQGRFVSTTDIVRYVVAPGCAARRNECHANEDFPDLSSEGNMWNLVMLPCNLGVGDRTTVEDFCEQKADELHILDGPNAGFITRIGSIDVISDDEDGEFVRYDVRLEFGPSQAATGASFAILRDGVALPALGGGAALEIGAGEPLARITSAAALPDPAAVRQGDENRNGIFGDGSGVLVRPGDAAASYLLHRLAGRTDRVRMPLSDNADIETQENRPLTLDEMYAVASWINCMQPGDGPYAPIRYDCAANAGNDGRSW
jgi:hypothetical protein